MNLLRCAPVVLLALRVACSVWYSPLRPQPRGLHPKVRGPRAQGIELLQATPRAVVHPACQGVCGVRASVMYCWRLGARRSWRAWRVLLTRRCCVPQLLGTDVVTHLVPTLEAAAADSSVEDMRVRQATVAEAVAGCMRGLPYGGSGSRRADSWAVSAAHADPASESHPQWSRLLSIAARIIDNLSVSWASDWAVAARWVVCRRVPSAAAPLIRYIVASTAQALTGAASVASTNEEAKDASSPAAGAQEDRFGMQTRWLLLLRPLLDELTAYVSALACV